MLTEIDRLSVCVNRLRWFTDNELDLKKDTYMPYLMAITVLIGKIKNEGVSDKLIQAVENILMKAEAICQPEDAHAFSYDPNWKLTT